MEIDNCPVCLNSIDSLKAKNLNLNNIQEGGDDVLKLVCGHMYHAECIKQTFTVNEKCPMCRADYYVNKIKLHLTPYRALPYFNEVIFDDTYPTDLNFSNGFTLERRNGNRKKTASLMSLFCIYLSVKEN